MAFSDDNVPWSPVVPTTSSIDELSRDERLAIQLQNAEFEDSSLPGLPHLVSLLKIKCVGTWSNLSLEIKHEIFKHNLVAAHPITAADFKKGYALSDARKELLQYRHVSKGFSEEAEQCFYQKNRIQLWPSGPVEAVFRYITNSYEHNYDQFLYHCEFQSTTNPVHIAFPNLRVGHYITRLDFYPPGTDIIKTPEDWKGILSSYRNLHEISLDSTSDTWQYLKNLALGKYGFPCLYSIRVFFGPEPDRMQAFWAWNIKVKTDDGHEVFCPDEQKWLRSLKWTLKLRTVELEIDEPGFELIRRRSKDTQIEAWDGSDDTDGVETDCD